MAVWQPKCDAAQVATEQAGAQARLEGGHQQTLGDCGIGPRAQVAGPEAPRRCPEHSTIARMDRWGLLDGVLGPHATGAVCSECGVDMIDHIVEPVGERAAQLCEEGRQRYGDVNQLGSQSQTDYVGQQNLVEGVNRGLLGMCSQLGSPAEGPVGEATNAGDGTAQGAGGPMQASGGDQAARVPVLLQVLGYKVAAAPRVVGPGAPNTGVLSTLLAGPPGTWLRRCVGDRRITQKAGAIFLGWVAAASTQEWLQLAGGGRSGGLGGLQGWRVAGSGGRVIGEDAEGGDSAWFATSRVRVMAALIEGEAGSVYQAT